MHTGWSPSLTLYSAVVIGSGVLAAWYLFVVPETRIVRPRPVVAATSPDA
ncbi:MAG: hypothetical protein LH650_07360 [Chloroflexi bacterium]|nr:hypothetical protein [Chloroflexota bacterium]